MLGPASPSQSQTMHWTQALDNEGRTMDRDISFPTKFISYEKASYNDNRDAVIS